MKGSPTLPMQAEGAPVRPAIPRSPSPARICVVAAGHLSTCPRMLKAADALEEAGYEVRVVSTQSTAWAAMADDDVRRSRRWRWQALDYRRATNRREYVWSGLRYHAARRLARLTGPDRLPLAWAARAYSRVHSGLVRMIRSEPCDLIYAGQNGALAAAAVAAQCLGVPYGLDLEDFHSAEQADTPGNRLGHELIERIEREILHGAVFLTCGSAAIADAYEQKYGVRPTAIHNTFPLPSRAPEMTVAATELKLYWFSQTIGPNRGLIDAVRGMGLAGIRGELHLRGRADEAFVRDLRMQARDIAPLLSIAVHDPAPPDQMIALCQGYDVGLAIEPGFSLNNRLALSNKAFTYMLSGLAVALTNTPGQRCLIDDLGCDAIAYEPGDAAALAAGLKAWASDRKKLLIAKQAAWEAARRRWHWEHAQERGALLERVGSALAAAATAGSHNMSSTHR